jgi:hypothetical protein
VSCLRIVLTIHKELVTAEITSNSLLITHVACIPSISLARHQLGLRESVAESTAPLFRGATPQAFRPVDRPIPMPLVKLSKRQIPSSAVGNPMDIGAEAMRLIGQLFTAMFSIGVVNSGGDLGQTCASLQSANALVDLSNIGINATQASEIVCTASGTETGLRSFNITQIVSAAVALYGVELAANFSGTVEPDKLCSQLDLGSLPALGVDVNDVKSFICGTTEASATASGIGGPSSRASTMETVATQSWANSSEGSLSSAGSGVGTGPSGMTATALGPTGVQALGVGPFAMGNETGKATHAASGSIASGTGSIPSGTGIDGKESAPGTLSATASVPTITGMIGNETARASMGGNDSTPTCAGTIDGTASANMSGSSLPIRTGTAGNVTGPDTDISRPGSFPAGTGTTSNETEPGLDSSGSGNSSAGANTTGASSSNGSEAGDGFTGTEGTANVTLTCFEPSPTGSPSSAIETVGNGTDSGQDGNYPLSTGEGGISLSDDDTNSGGDSQSVEGGGEQYDHGASTTDAAAARLGAESSSGSEYGATESTGKMMYRVPRGPTTTPRYYPEY